MRAIGSRAAMLMILTGVAAAAEQASPSRRYAYTRSLRVVTDDKHVDRVERFDPSRPPGGRWSLLALSALLFISVEATTRIDFSEFLPLEER